MQKEETSGQKQIYRTFALTFDQTKKLHVHTRAMQKSLLFSLIV